MNEALKVVENIYWVGARDYDIEVFDIVLKTDRGTTYNSYILKGENKIALFELCKIDFYDEFMERISSICDPSEIDYVITNHTEPDHTGSLYKLIELNPNIQVYGSKIAIEFLNEITNRPFNSNVINYGETLDLGGRTLEFIQAPFLHWPDSVFTYVKESKTLFTCDVFGAHFCSEEIFNDLIEEDYTEHYKYYYDCILDPFHEYVLKAIEKIEKLDITTICNGHGPVIRKELDKYINLYKEWATKEKKKVPSVVIPYASAYGYTKKMAEEIKKGIEVEGKVECTLFDLTLTSLETVLLEIKEADGILFGSSTILNDTLPPILNILAELNPVIHKGKIVGAFGSYGWSGEAVPNIESRLKQLRLKMPLESIRVKFSPTDENLSQCYEYGINFSNEICKLRKIN